MSHNYLDKFYQSAADSSLIVSWARVEMPAIRKVANALVEQHDYTPWIGVTLMRLIGYYGSWNDFFNDEKYPYPEFQKQAKEAYLTADKSELIKEKMWLHEQLLSTLRADHRCGVDDTSIVQQAVVSLQNKIAVINEQLKEVEYGS